MSLGTGDPARGQLRSLTVCLALLSALPHRSRARRRRATPPRRPAMQGPLSQGMGLERSQEKSQDCGKRALLTRGAEGRAPSRSRRAPQPQRSPRPAPSPDPAWGRARAPPPPRPARSRRPHPEGPAGPRRRRHPATPAAVPGRCAHPGISRPHRPTPPPRPPAAAVRLQQQQPEPQQPQVSRPRPSVEPSAVGWAGGGSAGLPMGTGARPVSVNVFSARQARKTGKASEAQGDRVSGEEEMGWDWV